MRLGEACTIPEPSGTLNYRRSTIEPSGRGLVTEDQVPGRSRSHESESTVDLTRRYLSELGSYPLLTAEQEVELAQAIEAGRLAEIELSSTTPARARKRVLTEDIE